MDIPCPQVGASARVPPQTKQAGPSQGDRASRGQYPDVDIQTISDFSSNPGVNAPRVRLHVDIPRYDAAGLAAVGAALNQAAVDGKWSKVFDAIQASLQEVV